MIVFSSQGLTDAPDPFWFLILAAILLGGFALLIAATWYANRRR